MKVSILVPIYNEEENLRELALRVNKVMQEKYGKDWELLLVDDISTDNSLKIMRELEKKYNNIKALTNKKKGGQTGCFQAGFDYADGDIIITMDGDLQVLPEDLPLFINKIEDGYDVVNGIREHRKHVFLLILLSRIYNLLMLIMFKCPVIDGASNYTAFKKHLVKKLRLKQNDHRYIIPIAIKKGAKSIGEVVIRHRPRKKGKSKYSLLKKLIGGGPEILSFWIRFKLGYFRRK